MLRSVSDWFLFSISHKAKFAIKVALAIALTYIFILDMGLEHASVAVVTIMLIASPLGVKDALAKGFLRVGGTIVGAIIGMSLIAIFPQQPLCYLIALSLSVTLFLYLRSAYTGDNTLFMLSAMTMMAVFNDGEVDTVFMYGIDRTFITILAITIYTLVFLFVWPSSVIKNDDAKTPTPAFVWLDVEHLKGAVQTLFIFWMATAFWYYFNPAGGFMVVMLATGLGAITSFSSVKPSVMAAVINISLFLAILIYIFILPALTHWVELSMLLFAYTFFAFYFFPLKLSILLLLGLNTLMITNTMSYNVDIFLGIVLVFDMVFAFLILGYYFPFSSKPEHLYVVSVERFLAMSAYLSHSNSLVRWCAKTHQQRSFEKLSFWGSQLDFAYFSGVKLDQVNALKEALAGLVLIENGQRTPSALPSADECDKPLEFQAVLAAIDWQELKKGRF